MKLKPFGGTDADTSLDRCEAILADLIERESDIMDEKGAKEYGNTPLAVRLDLIDEANRLLWVALNGTHRDRRRELDRIRGKAKR